MFKAVRTDLLHELVNYHGTAVALRDRLCKDSNLVDEHVETTTERPNTRQRLRRPEAKRPKMQEHQVDLSDTFGLLCRSKTRYWRCPRDECSRYDFIFPRSRQSFARPAPDLYPSKHVRSRKVEIRDVMAHWIQPNLGPTHVFDEPDRKTHMAPSRTNLIMTRVYFSYHPALSSTPNAPVQSSTPSPPAQSPTTPGLRLLSRRCDWLYALAAPDNPLFTSAVRPIDPALGSKILLACGPAPPATRKMGHGPAKSFFLLRNA
jgi:hypothetical protein